MRIETHGQHVEVTAALRDYVPVNENEIIKWLESLPAEALLG